jgi:hypothetical protein
MSVAFEAILRRGDPVKENLNVPPVQFVDELFC